MLLKFLKPMKRHKLRPYSDTDRVLYDVPDAHALTFLHWRFAVRAEPEADAEIVPMTLPKKKGCGCGKGC